MRKQAIPTPTLLVALGATLLFSIGMARSFIRSSDWASNDGRSSTAHSNTQNEGSALSAHQSVTNSNNSNGHFW